MRTHLDGISWDHPCTDTTPHGMVKWVICDHVTYMYLHEDTVISFTCFWYLLVICVSNTDVSSFGAFLSTSHHVPSHTKVTVSKKSPCVFWYHLWRWRWDTYFLLFAPWAFLCMFISFSCAYGLVGVVTSIFTCFYLVWDRYKRQKMKNVKIRLFLSFHETFFFHAIWVKPSMLSWYNISMCISKGSQEKKRRDSTYISHTIHSTSQNMKMCKVTGGLFQFRVGDQFFYLGLKWPQFLHIRLGIIIVD